MIRSRIALAVLLIGTALPGIALAAPSTPTPTSGHACGAPFDDLQGPFARRESITSVEPYRVTRRA
jgi:hypothetical protein